jgi:hypothetical protein
MYLCMHYDLSMNLSNAKFFEERAARGSQAKLKAILARVPAVPPRKGDER